MRKPEKVGDILPRVLREIMERQATVRCDCGLPAKLGDKFCFRCRHEIDETYADLTVGDP